MAGYVQQEAGHQDGCHKKLSEEIRLAARCQKREMDRIRTVLSLSLSLSLCGGDDGQAGRQAGR